MKRRHAALARQLDQRLGQCFAGGCVGREQPHAGDGRKRNRREQLGVIVEAVPPIGVGPGPVEHILAVGMPLQVEGRCRHQLAVTLENQMKRSPAGLLGDAAALLEQGEPVVVQKRLSVAMAQRFPLLRIDFSDGAAHPRDIITGFPIASRFGQLNRHADRGCATQSNCR